MYLHIAKYEMEGIDNFLELASNTRKSKQKSLKQFAAKASGSVSDDWLVDDFTQFNDFAVLSAEFALIGLWRCIELYRERTILSAFGPDAAAQAYKHREFKKKLASLNIVEERLRCSRSVDELRCLNNSIKHSQRVNNELADFRRWKNRQGKRLGELETHYYRLRPCAEQYLLNLENRLSKMAKSMESGLIDFKKC